MWHVTHDMWHLTRDTWHVTPDMWHLTCDTWRAVIIVSKFQLPSSYSLGVEAFWRFWGKRSLSKLMNELMTKVLVEQPRLHLRDEICRLYWTLQKNKGTSWQPFYCYVLSLLYYKTSETDLGNTNLRNYCSNRYCEEESFLGPFLREKIFHTKDTESLDLCG